MKKILVLLLFIGMAMIGYADTYPATYRVTTTLNVRRGPGTNYRKIGMLYRNNYVTVRSATYNQSRQWAEIDYRNGTGYVAMQYLSYQEPAVQEQTELTKRTTPLVSSTGHKVWRAVKRFFKRLWSFIKWGLIIICILLVVAFREEIIQAALFLAMFTGGGALLFWLLFDNSSLGASIGFIVGILIGLRIFLQSIDSNFFQLFLLAYWAITFPSWICNRLQFILTGPWRYIFKYTSIADSNREVLRPFLYFLQILLYIATTPLRLLNAVYYNIFVYGITELYDLTCEVFIPTNRSEGKGDILKWILWFPIRLVRYPLFHGSLALIEGAVWTVIDIFIPTITMYHGTNLEAANAILGSSSRNKNLGNQWLSGTFKASDSNNAWGGMGVYFAPSRRVARDYSYRARGTVFIACRVSLGKILNYSLAPRYVEINTGGHGNPSVLNRYAESNHYDTAEWWNGGYWEYCMFDWQNRYNYPWRIRPIYVFNVETGLAQHIDGGFRHWLFSKMVLDDILDSAWLTSLVIFAFIVVAWCLIWLLPNL